MINEQIIEMRDFAQKAMDALHLAAYYDGNGFPNMISEQLEIAKRNVQFLNTIMFPQPEINFIQSEIAAEKNVDNWLQERFNLAGKEMD